MTSGFRFKFCCLLLVGDTLRQILNIKNVMSLFIKLHSTIMNPNSGPNFCTSKEAYSVKQTSFFQHRFL